MEAPPVQYVTTSGGHSIAYSVSGAGRPLVFLGPALGGMAHLWRFFPEWMVGLTARFQLVQHDLRGHGMSDRGLPRDFAPDSDLPDVRSVLDRLRLERLVLFGLSGVGHLAVRYAIAHPEQVEALILSGTPISYSIPSFFRDLPSENWEFFLRSMVPPLLEPEKSQAWFESYKESTTYEDWQVRGRLSAESNIASDLPRLQMPVLALHTREEAMTSAEEAKQLAAVIPNVRLVMIKGSLALGDATEGIAAIERFLAEIPIKQKEPATGGGLSGRTDLSRRELEVLRLVAAGKSSREIGEELVLSRRTVERHVANIYLKTQTHGRAQVAVYARERGLF
jgi:pimeloyl-ACP methyl ester carboxylesterase/DNA-binding CsgD family transcriptional regulator